ncbi:MAG: HAMP domain-containing sensor histidine kinase [Sphingopyxis sp.]|nr:HAMP domain-containing sensor histidine kinase [Sphingopyxis sp.]
MRFVPGSIRGRMLLLSLGATLISLLVAGVVITHVLERVVTQGIDRRLDAEIALLASSVDANGAIDKPRLARLRGALYAGPEWHWQIQSPAETVASGNFPALDPRDEGRDERRGHHGRRDRPGPAPVEGRDRQGGQVHARQVTLDTAQGPVLLTASAPRSVIERPIRDAALPLLMLLGTLSGLLAIAGVLQLRYGLMPLDRLRIAVADIRAGRADAVLADQPAELQPLADELNSLARDNDAALAAARTSAANLAHALKTPVATLAIELADQPEPARQVARIDEIIRHHLARARGRVISSRWRTPVAPALADLAATISRLNADRRIAINLAIDPQLAVAVDPADLHEMMGNLIENAVRHADYAISIRAQQAERRIQIAVVDDGPGIPDSERERAMAPGVRLDERGNGDGFGLAIVRELAELYGGAVHLSADPDGGLAATVTLPAAVVE